MANIELRSLQSILGSMISRLKAETDVNDIAPGSVLMTILEAAASSDFIQEGKLLQLLNLRDIDKATGVDLENLAYEMGLETTRFGAASATVKLTFSDGAFKKASTTIYAGSLSPAAGDTTLKIVDGSGFSVSGGSIHIGRGSASSEYVDYISITAPDPTNENSPPYYLVNLAAALTKDHLVGEEVIFSQGGDRPIPAGTPVIADGGSGAGSIAFSTQVASYIPDGEDSISGILAVATQPGSSGNVARKKIASFQGGLWSTATVFNDEAASGGRDPETDTELRQRIKDHVHSLSAGTERAIIRAVVGVSDDEENKRVVSAFLRKPTSTEQSPILFIDDGTGFSPSFSGVGEEVIVTSANGSEKFFQLQKWPVVKAQVSTVGSEPFALSGGEWLLVEVDGVSEEAQLSAGAFRNAGQATAQEVAEAINAKFDSVEARAKNGVVFLTPTAENPDWVRIGLSSRAGDANSALRFPVKSQYTIRLYKNDRLLEKNGSEALIQSLPFQKWPSLPAPATLQLRIDGIDSGEISFSDLDFATYSSSGTLANASVKDWVLVFNRKVIGVTAVSQDDGTFFVKSKSGKSAQAEVTVLGGTLGTKIFTAGASSFGVAPEYKLNRLLGQIELSNALIEGDELKSGNTNTRGFVVSAAQSAFDLSLLNGRPAELVLITDAPYTEAVVAQSGRISFDAETRVQKITGALGQFSNVRADDCVHLYNLPRNGLFRVTEVAADGSFVRLSDPEPVSGSDTLNGIEKLAKFFRTDGLPQLAMLPTGNAVVLSDVASSLRSQILGLDVETTDEGALRLSTTRYLGDGALAIPSVGGTAKNLKISSGNYASNAPHVATIESSDLLGIPTGRVVPSSSNTTSPYLFLETGTSQPKEASNQPLQVYLGSASRVIRQPSERSSASQIVLRDILPLQRVAIDADLRASRSSGLELGQSDNIVFLIDNDPAKKTFDIPMYLEATVSGPSVPSDTEIDLTDVAGQALGSGADWANHRFDDYRVWFQASTTLSNADTNASLKVRAVQFGPNGERIKVGVLYPVAPETSLAASFSVSPSDDTVYISAQLSGGTERTINLQPGSRIAVSSQSTDRVVRFAHPTSLQSVEIGDIAVFTDSALSSANLSPMRVSAVTNLIDMGHAFEHVVDSVSAKVVSGTVTLKSAPSETIRVGDRVSVNGVTGSVSGVTSQTQFTATGLSSVVSETAVTVTVTIASGVTTVTLLSAPSLAYSVGDQFRIGSTTKTITEVNDILTYKVESGLTAATTVSATAIRFYPSSITHQAVKISGAPVYAPAIGDYIQVASRILSISGIVDTYRFDVDAPFSFSGLESGVMSRISIRGKASSAAETISASSASSVKVFELNSSENQASAIAAAINNTAGVKDLVFASAMGDGSGSISVSTEESGSKWSSLLNGESFVYSTRAISPAIRLKERLSVSPSIGDKVRLIPATSQNVKDHLSRKQISGLSIAANIELVDQGRRIQVSSKTPGGAGQVFAVGGRASGQSVLAVRGNVQEMSATRAQIEFDRSAIEFLAPGQTIKVYQPGRAKKDYPVSAPTSATTVAISVYSPNEGKMTFTTPLVRLLTGTSSSGTMAVRLIGRGRMRFESISGSGFIPSSLNANDWVMVGDGSQYAGVTSVARFSASNQGWFQVRETDSSTYFDVEGSGAEELVTLTANAILFASYHSARVGDQLSIGYDAPVVTANKGTFLITRVLSATEIVYENSARVAQSATALGSSGAASVKVLDQGYTTYRKVVMVAPKPADPTNRSYAVVEPGFDMALLSEGQGAKVSLPARLGFGTDPVPGVAGYSFWTGLKRKVQRVVDGYEPDFASFPGVGAAGVSIEVREPQIQKVQIGIKVKTSRGVSLQALSDTIKSAVAGYVNALGLGQDVVMSEVIRIVQEIPGVDACVLVYPAPGTERITVGDSSLARISASDILLS